MYYKDTNNKFFKFLREREQSSVFKHELWGQSAWVGIPALPLVGYVTWGKLFNLSVPPCLHLYLGLLGVGYKFPRTVAAYENCSLKQQKHIASQSGGHIVSVEPVLSVGAEGGPLHASLLASSGGHQPSVLLGLGTSPSNRSLCLHTAFQGLFTGFPSSCWI